ncbi:AraC family transcriptional regulator [bacterium D16-51]|nr:AraC family transcriptional regulator [bacterium D16-59]RKI60465.1 AraC family transcriptional regulator [bacterium D16-51]
MLDSFLAAQMLKLLHAPICIYSREGEVLKAYDETEGRKIIQKEDFEGIGEELTAPYIHVDENGISFCLMQTEEKNFIGLGKVRIYSFQDEETRLYPYCEKEEFTAVILILWKLLAGQEMSSRQLWEKNIDIGAMLHEQVTKGIFEIQEEGRYHIPYTRELREYDSIRRGDIDALKRSMDEVYSGESGLLAHDMIRQYKNVAICKISGAARSAIAGGVNYELAFSMSDAFIRNMEENLTDPVKIEQAAREAEYEYAEMVHNLCKKQNNSPLINQVRDYVFCHIHEAIRVKDIAEHIGVTPNYLSEQFSELMGMTLKQYIIEEKIVSSEQLLKYTDYTLQEISSYCAFSSQSRFSVYFQRKNGITPARYRKQYRNQDVKEE